MTAVTRKVLIPVDQSEHSERAVHWFLKYGMMAGDHLTLFHVVETAGVFPAYSAGPLPLSSIEAVLKEKEKEVHDLKKKFETILASSKIKGEFVSSSHFAHAGEAICHVSKEKDIDYIIMGNRGMGVLRRTFLGSISDFVLHHVHLPVTIIPPKPKNGHKNHGDAESNATN